MHEAIRIHRAEGVARITLDRPDIRNALDEAGIEGLERHLLALRDDRKTRVVVLRGAGSSLCAGLDVSAVKDIEDPVARHRAFAPIGRRRVRMLSRVLALLAELEQPTIATLRGYAVGGGFSLALACDLRLASEDAQCWFPEVDLGMALSPASTALLATHIGPSVAKEIVLTCRRLRANELEALGIVNRVVAADVLDDAVHQLAESLASKDAGAVQGSKVAATAFYRRTGVIRTDLLGANAAEDDADG